ncbi:MAG: PEGA domain-containing protein [Planctomycetota bacterium]
MRATALLILLVTSTACVERKLFIRTEPEGARVRVNGREVGESPLAWSFDQYGTVRVHAFKEGFVPHEQDVKLRMPWYQYPVLDFFADILWPGKIRDDHEVEIALQAEPELTYEEQERLAEDVGARAAAMRERMRAEDEPESE